MKLPLVAFDPALNNFGIAHMIYDTDSGLLELVSLELVQTEATKLKQVRKNSDDLERARQLHAGMMLACSRAAFAIAEIPTGTQSARGAMSNGIALGVLAGCPIPLIQVIPREVKLASVGTATATKEEMIEWAMAKYPSKFWLMRKFKGELRPIADNEHLADACAIAEAGIRTDQFKQAIAVLRITNVSSFQ
jgi:Holliday junction resolvasome RuvABC endonuclease subunit